MINSFINNIGS